MQDLIPMVCDLHTTKVAIRLDRVSECPGSQVSLQRLILRQLKLISLPPVLHYYRSHTLA